MLADRSRIEHGSGVTRRCCCCSVIGHQEQPAVTGKIAIKKATVKCSKIEAPLTAFTADVILVSDQLQVICE